ncbi:MAG: hypothetical protein KC620_11335, partial [Myxococcales bacterium]|nr:hypothetical protein [Myxococcales bacterium]
MTLRAPCVIALLLLGCDATVEPTSSYDPKAPSADHAKAQVVVPLATSDGTPIGPIRRAALVGESKRHEPQPPLLAQEDWLVGNRLVFPAVTPGTYTLTIDKVAFEPKVQTGIVLDFSDRQITPRLVLQRQMNRLRGVARREGRNLHEGIEVSAFPGGCDGFRAAWQGAQQRPVALRVARTDELGTFVLPEMPATADGEALCLVVADDGYFTQTEQVMVLPDEAVTTHSRPVVLRPMQGQLVVHTEEDCTPLGLAFGAETIVTGRRLCLSTAVAAEADALVSVRVSDGDALGCVDDYPLAGLGRLTRTGSNPYCDGRAWSTEAAPCADGAAGCDRFFLQHCLLAEGDGPHIITAQLRDWFGTWSPPLTARLMLVPAPVPIDLRLQTGHEAAGAWFVRETHLVFAVQMEGDPQDWDFALTTVPEGESCPEDDRAADVFRGPRSGALAWDLSPELPDGAYSLCWRATQRGITYPDGPPAWRTLPLTLDRAAPAHVGVELAATLSCAEVDPPMTDPPVTRHADQAWKMTGSSDEAVRYRVGVLPAGLLPDFDVDARPWTRIDWENPFFAARLSTEGENVLWVELQDEAGNTTLIHDDIVILDQTPPRIPGWSFAECPPNSTPDPDADECTRTVGALAFTAAGGIPVQLGAAEGDTVFEVAKVGTISPGLDLGGLQFAKAGSCAPDQPCVLNLPPEAMPAEGLDDRETLFAVRAVSHDAACNARVSESRLVVIDKRAPEFVGDAEVLPPGACGPEGGDVAADCGGADDVNGGIDEIPATWGEGGRSMFRSTQLRLRYQLANPWPAALGVSEDALVNMEVETTIVRPRESLMTKAGSHANPLGCEASRCMAFDAIEVTEVEQHACVSATDVVGNAEKYRGC